MELHECVLTIHIYSFYCEVKFVTRVSPGTSPAWCYLSRGRDGFHLETLVIHKPSSRKFTTHNDLY